MVEVEDEWDERISTGEASPGEAEVADEFDRGFDRVLDVSVGPNVFHQFEVVVREAADLVLCGEIGDDEE